MHFGPHPILIGNWERDLVTDRDVTGEQNWQQDPGAIRKNAANRVFLPNQCSNALGANSAERIDGSATHAVGRAF